MQLSKCAPSQQAPGRHRNRDALPPGCRPAAARDRKGAREANINCSVPKSSRASFKTCQPPRRKKIEILSDPGEWTQDATGKRYPRRGPRRDSPSGPTPGKDISVSGCRRSESVRRGGAGAKTWKRVFSLKHPAGDLGRGRHLKTRQLLTPAGMQLWPGLERVPLAQWRGL